MPVHACASRASPTSRVGDAAAPYGHARPCVARGRVGAYVERRWRGVKHHHDRMPSFGPCA
ncbi:hypothetical protein FIBSPDRAFT_861514 [Athelia psychrophila]|uniref:Uncharacterized protein n=1 Tax=Athelia psychrophila TaxID=1759441 RepID=A0A166J517_9AGAM|nr:hypothetical protein FIBSPDRAFT_877804 [Fibularhizoctonia sp. CBS 109695]KZP20507.1 hypothetical protein FIBSPDRAFT_861514 [Fibularhizoctonia sp. CBS 109695]